MTENKNMNSPQAEKYTVEKDNRHMYLKIAEYITQLKEVPESIKLQNAF